MSIAERIFNEHNIDFSLARRGGGWTNEVYIHPQGVLRLAGEGETRVIREMSLAKLLPDEVGFPRVIDFGVTENRAWTLCEYIDSVNLSEAWCDYNWDEKLLIVKKLFDITSVLHACETAKFTEFTNRCAWYADFDRESAYRRLDKCKKAIGSIACDVKRVIDMFFDDMPNAKPCLCHGDITLDNLLYNGKELRLIDFEHAAIAPIEMDVRSVLNIALISDPDAKTVMETQEGYSEYRCAVLSLISEGTSKVLLNGLETLFRLRFVEMCIDDNEDYSREVVSLEKACSGAFE